jgi:hypothetical protein
MLMVTEWSSSFGLKRSTVFPAIGAGTFMKTLNLTVFSRSHSQHRNGAQSGGILMAACVVFLIGLEKMALAMAKDMNFHHTSKFCSHPNTTGPKKRLSQHLSAILPGK